MGIVHGVDGARGTGGPSVFENADSGVVEETPGVFDSGVGDLHWQREWMPTPGPVTADPFYGDGLGEKNRVADPGGGGSGSGRWGGPHRAWRP